MRPDKKIKLGIIGLSKGNGHPYSWSAICNGYNYELMKNCPFEVIPKYLNERKFPNDQIKDARVTHIWTQSKDVSEMVSETCYIEKVVNKYEDMIGNVDGILLARDDAKNHFKMSKPFLDAGLPVYIDKPLATSYLEGKKILDLQKYPAQIFTCSALRYAKEFNKNLDDLDLGNIKKIDARISKDWEKYSIHIIEPLINLIPNRGRLEEYFFSKKENISTLRLSYEKIRNINISTLGSIRVEPQIKIIGEKRSINLIFKDTFFAFKYALNQFIKTVKSKEIIINQDSTLEIISLIEIGMRHE